MQRIHELKASQRMLMAFVNGLECLIYVIIFGIERMGNGLEEFPVFVTDNRWIDLCE